MRELGKLLSCKDTERWKMMEEKKRFLVKICEEAQDFADLQNLLNRDYRITGHTVLTHENIDGTSDDVIIYSLELQEPEVESKIVSVKSVDLNEVDGWLNQGYEVKDLYAKNATLIKKEIPKDE